MASAASGIQPATQAAWQQMKLSMAERNAARAEQQAQALRSEADSAQKEADRAVSNARNLKVEAGKAESNADQANRGLATIQTAEDAVGRLSVIYDRVAQVQAVPAETTAAGDTAIVNTQGQVTGQLVSVAA